MRNAVLLVLFTIFLVGIHSQAHGTLNCTSSGALTLTGDTGDFGCQGYSDQITRTWLIQLQSTSKRVRVQFNTFSTEANYDFLRVYDGPNESAPLLGSYSGSLIPGPFTATANSIFIKFVADQYVTGSGFTATWQPIQSVAGVTSCETSNGGVTLSGSTGSFGCSGYGSNVFSTWLINGSVNQRLVLNFLDFDTEEHYDFVDVYDGDSADAQLIGHFSGINLPAPITASGNQLFITLTTDYSFNKSGFTAQWTTITTVVDPCYNDGMRVVVEREGYVGCPYGYGNNVNSAWLINPPGDFVVKLDFLTFNLDNSDFVNVYDGVNNTFPLLATLSGARNPSSVVSSENSLYVQLISDSSAVGPGFTATYQSVHGLQSGGCSRSGTYVFTAAQDSLGCDGYYAGVTEQWVLVAQTSDQVISLNFQSFDTEANHDILSVYDGNSTDAHRIIAWSGNVNPDPIVSSGMYLTVRFVADNNNIQGAGFSAVYTSININPPSQDPTDCSSSHVSQLTDQEGTFGCDGYGNNVVVGWAIAVQDNFNIQLRFNSFFTEAVYDYVTIFDGPDDTYDPLGSYSGAFRPPAITSTSNYLYVTLTTDSGVTRSGFSASYTAHFLGNQTGQCYSSGSHQLTEPTDTFGCQGYGNGVTVDWLISVERNSIINLAFTMFDTESGYDTLKIYDGQSASSTLLGTYSGTEIPSPLTSTSNELFLVFTSDHNVNGQGFTASYVSVAPSSLSSCATGTHSVVLSEPAGTFGCNGYANSADYNWNINAVHGQRITLLFSVMDTENYYDYVKVYDGNSTRDTVLGTFSGNTVPSSLTSTGRYMLVTFHSDSSMSSGLAGFVAQYDTYGSFGSSCASSAHHSMTSHNGEFSCDGYGNSVTITWVIQSYGPIYLYFSRFDTEQNYDIVYVYDGNSTSDLLLGRFSGTRTNPVTSSGEYMLVKFTSDSSVNRSGFQAIYSTLIVNGDNAPVTDLVALPAPQENAEDQQQ